MDAHVVAIQADQSISVSSKIATIVSIDRHEGRAQLLLGAYVRVKLTYTPEFFTSAWVYTPLICCNNELPDLRVQWLR